MWNYALSGLVIGFIVGMVVNAILLRGVPRATYLTNDAMRRKYGLLNWGIALVGMIAGLLLAQTNL